MSDELNVLSVLGSVTPPGRMHRALNEALDRIGEESEPGQVLIERVDLAGKTIGFADGTPLDQLDDDSAELIGQISGADAVVLATPRVSRIDDRSLEEPARSDPG